MMKRILLLILLLLWSNPALAYDWTQDANCVGAWLLESSGSPQADSSTNSNALTVVGGATHTTTTPPKSYSSGYYDFSGTGQHLLDSTASSDLEMTGGTSAFTFTGWLNPDVFPADVFSSYIFRHRDSSSDDGWGCSIGTVDDISVFTNGDNAGYVDTSMVTGTWYHIATVFDQANTLLQIWVDGSTVYNNSSYADTSDITSGDAEISFAARQDADRELDGKLDELAMFNAPLDSTDINDILDNGLLQGSTAYQRGVMIFD